MEELTNDFLIKMEIKNFSTNTKKSYNLELRKYLNYCSEHCLKLNSESYQKYLSHLIHDKKLSECSLKQSIGAVKFFLPIPSTFPMN